MPIEKKQLIGGINTDDSERLLELSDYVNMENMRIGGSANGRDGRIENIPGTVLVAQNPFPGTNTEIGKCKDESRGRIFYFCYNPRPIVPHVTFPAPPEYLFRFSTASHNIICFDKPANKVYIVMANSFVLDGLNFSLDYPIDSYFVNGCLYFTDGLNEPRVIDVERGIKCFQLDYDISLKPYVFPIKQVNICWIRKPPVLPPSFTKQTVNISGSGSGTGYPVTATWYSILWSSGPSHGAHFFGYILKVVTPLGDTYYSGTRRQVSPTQYRIDLFTNNPIDPSVPNPALPVVVDFTTLPAVTAFGSVEEMINFYTLEADGSHYDHIINFFGDQAGFTSPPGPVTITNFPLPDALVANNFIRFDAFQFCWFFDYWNNERSVESKLSKTANYNYETETFDTIKVDLPLAEIIEQDVKTVNLAVRFVANSEDNYFIIKKWENNPGQDGSAIDAHNSQTQPLSYMFDNSSLGIALDKAYSAKKFDLVPLTSRTISPGKNRFYHGNYKIGYDAPLYTTLAASVRKKTDGGNFNEWIFIFINGGADKRYFIASDSGYYIYPFSFTPPAYPTTAAVGVLSKVANDAAGFVQYVAGSPLYTGWVANIQHTGATIDITGIPPVLLSNVRIFKTDASYKIGIHFIDFAGREFGEVTNDTLLVKTKDRDYSQASFETNIDWTLINEPTQIPADAKYYSIDITKCLRTRNFISFRTKKASYVDMGEDGKNTYAHSGYAFGFKGCAFDITILLSKGFGYVFNDGDLVKITDTANHKYTLKITGTEGNWLLTELQNLGDLNDDFAFMFEIFTPHKRSETESFFEQAQVFPILNPGTNNRAFAVTAGSFDGDVSLLQRNDGTDNYLVEAMSPNDHYWNIWNTDAGKSIGFDKIGQVILKDGVCFSNKFIPETKVNGLSSFDALDNDTLYEESGPITKLRLASKQQEDGTVMLGICEKGIVSVYLGETQLQANEGDAFVAQSVGVIGTKNLLNGNNGCMHITSVFEYLGQVWWLDMYNGMFCRYSNNGVYPVSNNKASRFFSKYCRKYMQDGATAINARNGFYLPIVGVDPFNGEVLISLPATEDPGYCGQLPGFDFTPSYAASLDNPYDFYDGKAKTVSFKFKNEFNRWAGSHGWVAEGMDYLGRDFYGWKNGNLYQFEADPVNTNTTFGVRYPGRVCFTSNVGPSDIRLPLTVSVEGSDRPTFSHLYTEKPYKQSTDLAAKEYEKKNGVYYADFKNNRLSLNVPLQNSTPATAVQKRIKGERIRTATPFVMLEFAIYDKLINIDFINVGYRQSSGHRV